MHRYVKHRIIAAVLAVVLTGLGELRADEIAKIQSDRETGFSNGAWNLDRYTSLEPLDAGKRINIADLTGPGTIREIYVSETIKQLREQAQRGVVLEIWFDDAKEPAVLCPVADFFLNGCNGQGQTQYFETQFIANYATCSQVCYFPMPFRKRAQVFLRNDTKLNLPNYSFVEWEKSENLSPDMGYFHAAFSRKCIQLKKDSEVTFFEVHGAGHLIGRQFSIVTNEPLFRNMAYIMEANNEVDIDGHPRAIDYLGTECSFNWGWGWRLFAGLRSGVVCQRQITDNPDYPFLDMLSTYRFHDHMPIRFRKSLRWHMNWCFENLFRKWSSGKKWDEALARNGCWVDYATVHYWYQNAPGGYQHEALPTLEDRTRAMLLPAK